MRPLFVCLVVLTSSPLVDAGAPALKEAKQRLLRGNYAEARDRYETLVKEPRHRIPAAVGLSRAWRSEGEYDKALAALDAALKDHPKSADLHAERADVLYARGRWDEAQKAANEALTHSKNQFLA